MRRVLLAVPAVLVALLAPVSAAAAPAPTPAKPDLAKIGIKATAVVQDGPRLVWALTLRAHWTVPDFGRRALCLIPVERGVTTPGLHLCVRRQGSALVVRRERQDADGTVRRARRLTTATLHRGARSLRIGVRLDDLGLKPGHVRARARVLATDGDCLAPAPPPMAGADAPPLRCATLAPAKAWLGLDLAQGLPTTCVAAGASYRTQGPTSPRAIALTFDDGPWPTTGRILDILEGADVPATFFVIGQQVAAHAATLQRELADGFAIGDHTWSHAYVAGGGPAATSQIARTRDAIRRATGYTPCLFRAPYGAVGSDLISRARDLGMLTIEWSADPQNWARPGVDAIVARLLAQASPGGILLMHDGGGDRSQTIAALPQVIQGLRDRGYAFATVPDLLGLRTVQGWPPARDGSTS